MKGGDIMEPTLEKKNPLKAAFANLRWFEWVMFAGMILIGAYYMVTDKVSIGVCIFLCAETALPECREPTFQKRETATFTQLMICLDLE